LRVSIIVAVYKDIEALDLIVKALKTQTYKDFELIVAEDNDAIEMKEYVDSITGIDVIHTFQEDITVRKSRSQNNAILASTGAYLIFIDGDCVPYSTFIEGHVALAKKKRVLSGRRVNLGPKYSKAIREQKLSSLRVEKEFIWRYPLIARDTTERHSEAGFYFDPKGLIYNTFLKNRSSNIAILGCNFSIYKEDFVAVNGFDEGYGASPLSDDTDLQWRFIGMGYKIKSCKNIANIFHLNHKRNISRPGRSNQELMELFNCNQKSKKYVCEKGINTH